MKKRIRRLEEKVHDIERNFAARVIAYTPTSLWLAGAVAGGIGLGVLGMTYPERDCLNYDAGRCDLYSPNNVGDNLEALALSSAVGLAAAAVVYAISAPIEYLVRKKQQKN